MAKTFKAPESAAKPSPEEIAKRAYEIFERNGRKQGQDLANWLAAETELVRENGRASAQAAGIQPDNGSYRKNVQRQPS